MKQLRHRPDSDQYAHTIATHGSQQDDCEHRRAYERALAYSLSKAMTATNANKPVIVVTFGRTDQRDEMTDGLNSARIHSWDDSRAYYCPSDDCPCHSTRPNA